MSWDLSTLDPTDDWEIFDGREDVRYYSYDAATDAHATVAGLSGMVNVLVRAIDAKVVSLENGETVMVSTRIHVPFSSFNTQTRPVRRAKFRRQDGTVFVVWDVMTATFGTRYQLDCYQGS